MKCMVCGSKERLHDISELYTIGSEGTRLCHKHYMATVNFVRDMAKKEALRKRTAAIRQKARQLEMEQR